MKKFVLLAVALAAACGKKGPPLAPFAQVSAPVANVTALRMGDDVYVSFPVPVADIDGRKPATIESFEVYAITAGKAPDPADKKHLALATLVSTVPVRPILPELPPAPDGSPLPVLPLPPGVNRDVPAVIKEEITPMLLQPVVLPSKFDVKDVALEDADTEPLAWVLVAPPATELPHRYYFVVAISPRGRKSPASSPVGLPLDTGSSAPGTPTIAYNETAMTITWAPSGDARTATIAPVAPLPPVVPPAAPARPLLPARSLGFTTEATTYHLYEVRTAASEAAPEPEPGVDPDALIVPKPMTLAPLIVAEHVISGFTFGAERCFFVRGVDKVFGMVVQSAASPTTCVSPVDTFPPAAPRSLAAIAGEGVISLIWEPNTEPDLAGYLVLRGDAPGDTLQAITAEPVAATAYRDTTARPGMRYVYVVVAVDRASPQNVSAQSSRVEETAR